jgi:hypothetical protein
MTAMAMSSGEKVSIPKIDSISKISNADIQGPILMGESGNLPNYSVLCLACTLYSGMSRSNAEGSQAVKLYETLAADIAGQIAQGVIREGERSRRCAGPASTTT